MASRCRVLVTCLEAGSSETKEAGRSKDLSGKQGWPNLLTTDGQRCVRMRIIRETFEMFGLKSRVSGGITHWDKDGKEARVEIWAGVGP